MDKLRKEFHKERKMMAEIMKTVVIERPAVVKKNPPVSVSPHSKLTIDPEKLEKTIQKACIPIVKKTITVIDKLPVAPVESSAAPVKTTKVTVSICRALNLNGTPCKFRAKNGHFCAKHAH